MPAVSVIGDIEGCEGFSKDTLFCRWRLVVGHHHWAPVAGATDGQTQAARTRGGVLRRAVWSHPIDATYSSASCRGWPKLCLEVWEIDSAGRVALVGNGFCFVPTSPGRHQLGVPMWQAEGNFCERLTSFFLGSYQKLRSTSIVHEPADRFGLRARSVGVVQVELQVCLTGFDEKGVSVLRSDVAKSAALSQ